jgi:MYXO-CTERM domain-containing protein
MQIPVHAPIFNLKLKLRAFAMVAVLGGSTIASAGFLDLTSVTAGASGSFAGTLNGVTVNGSISTPDPGGRFVLDGTAFITGWQESVINNTSPQFRYSNIYTPSTPLTDDVGYTSFAGTVNPATITLTFSAPQTNLVFDVANLDAMQYVFSLTGGLSSLALLSGNGGGGDGLQVVGNVISDATGTGVGQQMSDAPFTSGARSAYGSVELVGTYSSLTIAVNNPAGVGDGGTFTLNTVPEPTTLGLGLAGMALLAFVRRRGTAGTTKN